MYALSLSPISICMDYNSNHVCSFTEPNLCLYGLQLQSRMLFHSAQSLSVWITTPIMYALSLSPISICMDYDSNHVCSFTQPNLCLYGLQLQSCMLFHSAQSLSVWITTPIMYALSLSPISICMDYDSNHVCSFTQPNLYLYGLRLQSCMLFHSAQSLSVWITTPITYALSLSPISICMDYDSNHVCSFTQPNLYLYGLRLQSCMLFHSAQSLSVWITTPIMYALSLSPISICMDYDSNHVCSFTQPNLYLYGLRLQSCMLFHSAQSLSVWITTPITYALSLSPISICMDYDSNHVCSFTQPNLYLYGLRLQSRMLFHSAQSLSVWITTPIMYALSLSPISICMDYDSNHVCSFTQPNLYLYGLRLQSCMLFHSAQSLSVLITTPITYARSLSSI